MDSVVNKITIVIFLVFIFGISILNLITPDQKISEIENRPLKQRPTFSLKTFIAGDYSEDMELYLNDQFYQKEAWVGLKSDMERLLQKHENNGVYFAKDGYLLEVFDEAGVYFDRNLEFLNIFCEKMSELSTTVMLVPTAVKVHEDKLHLFASPINQAVLIEQAKDELGDVFLDVYPLLNKHRLEYIYYRTDHHWTTLGAYYAYQQLLEWWEMPLYLDYDVETVSTEFYGTYYSQANNFHLLPDVMNIYLPKEEQSISLTWDDQTESLDSLYNMEYLEKKDKYSMFLNGNHALTIIKNETAPHNKLLIFKDSYAHNLVPFLTMHFNEIHCIDLRYYNQNLYDYIREEGFNQVLFLYNLSTFGDEASLIKLKAFQ